MLATQARGAMLFFEKLFESRMYFVDRLIDMGARSCSATRTAWCTGPPGCTAAISSPDIRAGMALMIAALCAKGRERIEQRRVIDRGYERIEARLRALGADIVRDRRHLVDLSKFGRSIVAGGLLTQGFFRAASFLGIDHEGGLAVGAAALLPADFFPRLFLLRFFTVDFRGDLVAEFAPSEKTIERLGPLPRAAHFKTWPVARRTVQEVLLVC